MKVFLDDVRSAPKGWRIVRQPMDAIKLLKTNKVTEISLDHDLGGELTGYDVLTWIEGRVFLYGFKAPVIYIHTSNPSARMKMSLAVEKIQKLSEK